MATTTTSATVMVEVAPEAAPDLLEDNCARMVADPSVISRYPVPSKPP